MIKSPNSYNNQENLFLTIFSAQRLNDLGDESRLLPLWRQAEPRFLWNNYMLEVFIDNKLDPYMLPVIQGCMYPLHQFLIYFFQSYYSK